MLGKFNEDSEEIFASSKFFEIKLLKEFVEVDAQLTIKLKKHAEEVQQVENPLFSISDMINMDEQVIEGTIFIVHNYN